MRTQPSRGEPRFCLTRLRMGPGGGLDWVSVTWGEGGKVTDGRLGNFTTVERKKTTARDKD